MNYAQNFLFVRLALKLASRSKITSKILDAKLQVPYRVRLNDLAYIKKNWYHYLSDFMWVSDIV